MKGEISLRGLASKRFRPRVRPRRPMRHKSIASRYAKINQHVSSSINFDLLPPGDTLQINQNGAVIVDPDNPSHRRWLED
jgi:hypothetical protein